MLASDSHMAVDSHHLGGLLNKVSIGQPHQVHHPSWAERPSPAPLQLGSTSHDPFRFQHSATSSANASYRHDTATTGRVFPPPLEQRSYTILKEVGDGSFGTVWLADWHSPLHLPTGTSVPGPSSRPEYKGKRLVAIKRMKKAFEGGWSEAMKLKELKASRALSGSNWRLGSGWLTEPSLRCVRLAVAPTNPDAPQHYPPL